MVNKFISFLEKNNLSQYFNEDWDQFSIKNDRLKSLELLEAIKVNKGINQQALAMLRDAYTVILTNFGFFADLLLKLKLVQVTDANVVDTMATDGKSIFYNPEFTVKLTKMEVPFIICHEILHNALFHFDRIGERYPHLWNVAGDFAINLLLHEMGSDTLIKMPQWVLFDEKYKDMSTEQIYEQLLPKYEEDKKKFEDMISDMLGEGDGGGDSEGKAFGPNDVKDPGKTKGTDVYQSEEGQASGSDEMANSDDMSQLKRLWKDAMTQAKSRNPGSISTNMDRFVHKFFKPKVNWRSELKRFVSKIMNKLDYQIPARRFASRGIYWPGVTRKEQNSQRNVVIAIDTSGSIGDDELSLFASEMAGIFKLYTIKDCYVIWCDSEIPENGVQHFKVVDEKFDIGNKLAPVGGGGTSFVPPFKWINDNLMKKGTPPSFVIYFTDAYGDAPPKSMVKQYADRVLWIITQNQNPDNITWGKRILIDELT